MNLNIICFTEPDNYEQEKKKQKSQKISMNLQKKKKDELQKRLRRETKTSGSKISINLGREGGEWRSISLKKKKYGTLENHCSM